MVFAGLLGKNYIRQRLLKKTQSSVMKAFLSREFPSRKALISGLDIVSVDFETTGLDIKKDNIISIGTVNIACLNIELNTSIHQLITQQAELNEESVVIHNITDTALRDGLSIDLVLPTLLERLSGKVMLAHNAGIELGFLNRLCRAHYNTDFIIPVIDTLQLAKRSFALQNKVYKDKQLRLFNLRKLYNMPVYKAHNSQMDAIATAELFLAMVSHLSPKGKLRLGDCSS